MWRYIPVAIGIVFVALLWSWLAAAQLPQPTTPEPVRQTFNFSTHIQQGGVFQLVVVSAKGFIRRALTIQNNNRLVHACYIFVPPGKPNKEAAYLLLPGQEYRRLAPLSLADDIYATCEGTGDTLFVEIQ